MAGFAIIHREVLDTLIHFANVPFVLVAKEIGVIAGCTISDKINLGALLTLASHTFLALFVIVAPVVLGAIEACLCVRSRAIKTLLALDSFRAHRSLVNSLLAGGIAVEIALAR